jgi:hypothetical protein
MLQCHLDEYQKTELDGTGKPLGERDAEGLHKLPEKQVAELGSNAVVELREKQVAELEGNIVAECTMEVFPSYQAMAVSRKSRWEKRNVSRMLK